MPFSIFVAKIKLHFGWWSTAEGCVDGLQNAAAGKGGGVTTAPV